MHPLFFAVVLITTLQGANVTGTATGFFYSSGANTYLVTNRHVVAPDDQRVRPDRLRIRLHKNAGNDLSANVEEHVPLYAAGKPRWYQHRRYPVEPVDVAVIEVDRALTLADYQIRPLSRANFFPRGRLLLLPGEDVMLMGYPLGASDVRNNLPIVRHASVATAYGVHFNGEAVFLIDAILHPGMSGSPVLTKPKSAWPATEGGLVLLPESPIHLLGVYSGYADNLGMGKVWYADAIEEIISTIVR
jgi:S1-C subfamily serine protease